MSGKFVVIGVAFVVVGYLLSHATTAKAPVPAYFASIPTDERTFIHTVAQARRNYRAAGNDMQKGGERAKRSTQLCQVASTNVDGWLGTISQLSSNGDGKGVLSIQLAENMTISTWNNSLSDLGDGTLIEPSSPLFGAVSKLNVGDTVRVGGVLFHNGVDCFREKSLTLNGSMMTSPDFLARFQYVERY